MQTMAIMLQDLVVGSIPKGVKANHTELFKAYADKAWEVVTNWDIRCAGRLRDLFPDAFPKSLRKGKLIAYMMDNENADWAIEAQRI